MGLKIRYEPRTTIKGQVLAEFIADFTPGAVYWATRRVDFKCGWSFKQ